MVKTFNKLAGIALTVSAFTGTLFAAGELRPFPQHEVYSGVLRPSNVSQTTMDSQIKAKYDAYKTAYLKGPVATGSYTGGYYPLQNTVTTSEAHSYAMYITVLMAGYDANAKTIFDGLVKFYLAHRSIGGNTWGMNWNPQSVTAQETSNADGDAATDGDMGIAYALVMADRQWGGSPTGVTTSYIQLAKNIMGGMLNSQEMAAANNGVLQIADDAYSPTLSRTSDWMIDHFKVYEAIDPTNASKYEAFVTKIHTQLNTSTVCNSTTGLLPGFVLGSTPNKGPESASEAAYAYNSCRDPWRLAMAAMHSNDTIAKKIAIRQATWAYGVSPTFQLKDGGYTLAGSPNQPGWGPATGVFIGPFAVAAQLTGNQTMVNNAWNAAVNASSATEPVYDDGVRLLSLLAASGNWWNPIGVQTTGPVITSSATTTGGSITPSGSVGVTLGNSQLFTITPDAGYGIEDVKVNGVSKGAISTYTMNNVQGDSTIAVSFKATANRELLTNGTFNTDFASWAYSNDGTGTGTGKWISPGQAQLNTTAVGTFEYEQAISQSPFTLTQGKLYRFKFDVTGTGTKSMEASVMMADTPWTGYFTKILTPSTTKTTHTSYFKMIQPTDPTASVSFQSSLQVGKLFFDNVSLMEMLDSALAVTSQNDTATVNSGSIVPITWSTTSDIGNVSLEWSADTGRTWTSISASIANTGSYSWTAPAISSKGVLFRVSAVATPSISDISDSPITIKAAADAIKPVISNVPANIAVTIGAGTADTAITWVAATASDNVGVTSFTCSPTSGSKFAPGVTTVTYTAKDAANNTTTATFTVTVTKAADTQKPTITSKPSNIAVTISPAKNDTTITWTAPTASDNVGVTSIVCSPVSGSIFAVGTNKVIITAKDAANNSVTDSFTVTVTKAPDITAPVISNVPGNITKAITFGKTDTTITWTAASATDNVGVTSFTCSPSSGSAFTIGAHTVTYTATDAAGNSSTATFTVTITEAADAVEPVIANLPSDITAIVSTGKTDTTITWNDATASDNDGVKTFVCSPVSGSLFTVGTHTVTYTATDTTGNVATASFTVTITEAADTEKPVITNMPANIDVTIGSKTADTTVTWIEPTATDNKAGVSLVSSHTSGVSVFTPGVSTVTYTATDAAGNVSTASFTVTVTQLTSTTPVITGTTDHSTVEESSIDLSVAGLTITGGIGALSLIVENGPNYTVTDSTVIPNENFYGDLAVAVRVTDGVDTSAVATVKVTVSPINDTATTTLPDTLYGKESVDLNLDLNSYFADVDNATLSISADLIPEGVILTDGILSGIATPDDYTMTLTATDTDGASVSKQIVLRVERELAITKSTVTAKAKQAGIQAVPTVVNRSDSEAHFVIADNLSGNATVTVFDIVGNVIDQKSMTLSRGGHYTWDLTNRNGVVVTNGTYLVILDITTESGSHEQYRSMMGIQR